MGFIADVFSGIFDFIGDVIGKVVDVVGKAIKFAMDNPLILVAAGIGIAAYAGSIAAAGAGAGAAGGTGGATFGGFVSQGATVAATTAGSSGASVLAGATGFSQAGVAAANTAAGLGTTAAGVGAAAAPGAMAAAGSAVGGAVAGAAGNGFLSGIVKSGKGLLNWAENNQMLASTAFQSVAGGLNNLRQDEILKDQRAFELDYMDKKYNKEYDTAVALEEEKRRMNDEEQMQAYGGLLDIQGATGQTNQQLIGEAGLLNYQPRLEGSQNEGYAETMQGVYS